MLLRPCLLRLPTLEHYRLDSESTFSISRVAVDPESRLGSALMTLRRALFLALPLGLMFGCETSSDDLLKAADELVFRGEYKDASAKYEAVLVEVGDKDPEQAPVRIRALTALADLRHHYLSDRDGALRAYRAVADLSPGTDAAFDARLAAARLLRDGLADVDNAIAELAAVVDAFPSRPEIPALRIELASLAVRAGHYDDARLHAERAAGDAKVGVDAQVILASLHALGGRPDQALTIFRRLLAGPLEPATAARVRFEVGHLLETQGRFEEAIAAYEEAQGERMDPGVIEARVSRVKARLANAKVGARRAGTSIRP